MLVRGCPAATNISELRCRGTGSRGEWAAAHCGGDGTTRAINQVAGDLGDKVRHGGVRAGNQRTSVVGVTQTPDGIQLRQAQPADYESVVKMHYPSWRESYAGILAPNVLDMFAEQNWSDDEYPHRLNRPGWSMWLAEADGQLIGMSIFGPELENPDHLEIDALYIAVESQRRGVGSVLLDNALGSRPTADVVLWCAEGNHRARRFYESKGFELDGRAFTWTLIPGVVEAPQVGYTLHRSAGQAEVPITPTPPHSPAS